VQWTCSHTTGAHHPCRGHHCSAGRPGTCRLGGLSGHAFDPHRDLGTDHTAVAAGKRRVVIQPFTCITVRCQTIESKTVHGHDTSDFGLSILLWVCAVENPSSSSSVIVVQSIVHAFRICVDASGDIAAASATVSDHSRHGAACNRQSGGVGIRLNV